MKNKLLTVILIIGAYAIFTSTNAQQEVITVEKPFIAKSLSGIITDANGGKLSIVTVIRFTADWKNEIESVETDVNGKFSFKKLPAGIYYLIFSAEGFNKLRIKVQLKRNSKAKLKLKLAVSN